jgi:ubiquinone/menaquinone biosynthesis C-methylase UbiE
MNSGRSPASVAEYYDRAAESWDQSHGAARQNPRFARQIRNSLERLLSGAGGTATALELGAGTGPYVDITAPLFTRLIATDLSEGMLAVFARRVVQLGLLNVTLLRQDACDLREIVTGSVDVVYSIGLLETVSDITRLFAESSRVLRPGGSVVGITSNGDCPWYSLRRKLEGGERYCRSGRLVTAATLAEVLRRTGFTLPKVTYWGAAPPGMQNSGIIAVLAAAEAIIEPTPLARYLGVLSFSAYKLAEELHARQTPASTSGG